LAEIMLKDIFENRKVNKFSANFEKKKEKFLCCFTKERNMFKIKSNFIFEEEALWDRLLT